MTCTAITADRLGGGGTGACGAVTSGPGTRQGRAEGESKSASSPLCGQQMPEWGSQLANNRAGPGEVGGCGGELG